MSYKALKDDLTSQLEKLHQLKNDTEQHIASVKHQLKQIEDHGSLMLTDVVLRAIETPYFKLRMSEMLYHHASEEECQLLSEYLGIPMEVIQEAALDAD